VKRRLDGLHLSDSNTLFTYVTNQPFARSLRSRSCAPLCTSLQDSASFHHSYGIGKTIKTLVKEEGPGILLAGLGPTTVGYFFEGALKFGIYEILKPILKLLLGPLGGILGSNMFSFVVAGALAGVAASIVLCPMEALRIRLVSEPRFTEKVSLVSFGINFA